MLAALGQVAHIAVGIGSNPLTIIGLVPIFAAGLAFMRYISVDPESHPVNVRYVSYLVIYFCSIKQELMRFLRYSLLLCYFKLNKTIVKHITTVGDYN